MSTTNIIKIDENTPMPPQRATGKSYPFADMKVGNSFFEPTDVDVTPDMAPDEAAKLTADRQRRQAEIMRQRVHRFNKANPDYKFSVRHWDEKGKPGIRVWRIETPEE